MAKAKSVIITCAVTGGIHTPTMSPHLPITPQQIASEAIAASEAGASIIHLHARNAEDGRPAHDPDVFMEFLPVIKQSTNAVVNISTGGGLGMTLDQRLAAARRASPEMASLNMGSLNFGLFPLLDKYKTFKHDWEPEFLSMTNDFIFKNTFKDIEYVLKDLGEGHGTKFEMECYDLGHLYNVAHFVDRGLIKPPFFLQLIYGILGGAGAEIDNLVHMNSVADRLFGDDYEWSVLAAGKNQMGFASTAGLLGGNVRVGLEDSLYIGRGQLAESNADQVAKIKRIVEDLSLTVATPDEARQRLALKGGDQVGF